MKYEAFVKLTLAIGRVRRRTQRTPLIDHRSESVANYHESSTENFTCDKLLAFGRIDSPQALPAVSQGALNLPTAPSYKMRARQAPIKPICIIHQTF